MQVIGINECITSLHTQIHYCSNVHIFWHTLLAGELYIFFILF